MGIFCSLKAKMMMISFVWIIGVWIYFRDLVRTLSTGVYLVYLTTDVLRWIQLCNNTNMVIFTYEERIVILSEADNYELTRYLWRIRHRDPEENENSE